ncbi:hypothetical protein BGX33_006403 [Mortierella sp. NVP41]|nr:hypothetical protein BGX33_006403 [Mortierella sp. NVP41]
MMHGPHDTPHARKRKIEPQHQDKYYHHTERHRGNRNSRSSNDLPPLKMHRDMPLPSRQQQQQPMLNSNSDYDSNYNNEDDDVPSRPSFNGPPSTSSRISPKSNGSSNYPPRSKSRADPRRSAVFELMSSSRLQREEEARRRASRQKEEYQAQEELKRAGILRWKEWCRLGGYRDDWVSIDKMRDYVDNILLHDDQDFQSTSAPSGIPPISSLEAFLRPVLQLGSEQRQRRDFHEDDEEREVPRYDHQERGRRDDWEGARHNKQHGIRRGSKEDVDVRVSSQNGIRQGGPEDTRLDIHDSFRRDGLERSRQVGRQDGLQRNSRQYARNDSPDGIGNGGLVEARPKSREPLRRESQQKIWESRQQESRQESSETCPLAVVKSLPRSQAPHSEEAEIPVRFSSSYAGENMEDDPVEECPVEDETMEGDDIDYLYGSDDGSEYVDYDDLQDVDELGDDELEEMVQPGPSSSLPSGRPSSSSSGRGLSTTRTTADPASGMNAANVLIKLPSADSSPAFSFTLGRYKAKEYILHPPLAQPFYSDAGDNTHFLSTTCESVIDVLEEWKYGRDGRSAIQDLNHRYGRSWTAKTDQRRYQILTTILSEFKRLVDRGQDDDEAVRMLVQLQGQHTLSNLALRIKDSLARRTGQQKEADGDPNYTPSSPTSKPKRSVKHNIRREIPAGKTSASANGTADTIGAETSTQPYPPSAGTGTPQKARTRPQYVQNVVESWDGVPLDLSFDFPMYEDIITVPELWQFWKCGWNGQPSVMQLTMKHGASWRKTVPPFSLDVYRWYYARYKVIQAIEEWAKLPEWTIELAILRMEQHRGNNKLSGLHQYIPCRPHVFLPIEETTTGSTAKSSLNNSKGQLTTTSTIRSRSKSRSRISDTTTDKALTATSTTRSRSKSRSRIGSSASDKAPTAIGSSSTIHKATEPRQSIYPPQRKEMHTGSSQISSLSNQTTPTNKAITNNTIHSRGINTTSNASKSGASSSNSSIGNNVGNRSNNTTNGTNGSTGNTNNGTSSSNINNNAGSTSSRTANNRKGESQASESRDPRRRRRSETIVLECGRVSNFIAPKVTVPESLQSLGKSTYPLSSSSPSIKQESGLEDSDFDSSYRPLRIIGQNRPSAIVLDLD